MSAFLGLTIARPGLSTALEAVIRSSTRLAPRRPTTAISCCCATPSSKRFLPVSQYGTLLLAARRAQGTQPRRDAGTRSIFWQSSVVTRYVDLPPDYDEKTGLAFGRKDLGAQEVVAILGHGLPTAEANRLLRILHGQRVSGSLQDPEAQQHTSELSPAQIEAALQYLRTTVPVDEVANAGLRAEDELRELEEEIDVEAEKDGATGGDQESASGRALSPPNGWWARRLVKTPATLPTPASTSAPTDVYGESAIDRIRARNIARRKEEEQRRVEEEEKRREEQAADAVSGTLQGLHQATTRELSPQMKRWKELATSNLTEPPRMSAWARLWPSYALITALIVGGTVAAQYYSPPEPYQRLFPDIPPATATVAVIIAANIAIWGLWKVPPLWRNFNRYMLVVAATPRPLSLLGTAFSHQSLFHLSTNMLFLWYFGTMVHEEVGRAHFVQLYLTAGSVGFLTSLTEMVLWSQLHLSTLGASGAVYGIAVAYFMLHQVDGFRIFNVPAPPSEGIPGVVFIATILGIQLAQYRVQKKMVDIVSHLGGILVGLVFGQYLAIRKAEQAAAAKQGRGERPVLELIREKGIRGAARAEESNGKRHKT